MWPEALLQCILSSLFLQCIEVRDIKIPGGHYSSGDMHVAIEIRELSLTEARVYFSRSKGEFRLIIVLNADKRIQMDFLLVFFVYNVHARFDTSITWTNNHT